MTTRRHHRRRYVTKCENTLSKIKDTRACETVGKRKTGNQNFQLAIDEKLARPTDERVRARELDREQSWTTKRKGKRTTRITTRDLPPREREAL